MDLVLLFLFLVSLLLLVGKNIWILRMYFTIKILSLLLNISLQLCNTCNFISISAKWKIQILPRKKKKGKTFQTCLIFQNNLKYKKIVKRKAYKKFLILAIGNIFKKQWKLAKWWICIYHHPRSSTTSQNSVTNTHDHLQPSIILPPQTTKTYSKPQF